MSIKAIHFIVGDSSKAGFGRLDTGMSSFPADELKLLNGGASVKTGGGARIAAMHNWIHVWEYETGRFGVPVIINTGSVMTGRSHAYSEYVYGDVRNESDEKITVAEIVSPEKLISAAIRDTKLMQESEFLSIDNKHLYESADDLWRIEEAQSFSDWNQQQPAPEVLRTMLYHYWLQASRRAFTHDGIRPVRICFGSLSEDREEETEKTIELGQRFFTKVLSPNLPLPVQNIASMAAGVDDTDKDNGLFTALRFVINEGHDQKLTFEMTPDGWTIPQQMALNAGEDELMKLVLAGKRPEYLTMMLGAMRRDIPEARITFAADLRLWRCLYYVERIAEDGNSFIRQTDLGQEIVNDHVREISGARAAYRLMKELREVTKAHVPNSNAVEVLLDAPMKQLQAFIMRDLQENGTALVLNNMDEMTELHRHVLSIMPEGQLMNMAQLVAMDQAKRAGHPDYIYVFSSLPLNTPEIDKRAAVLLKVLLEYAYTPLVDEICQRGEQMKKEDTYLVYLLGEQFLNWSMNGEQTKEAMKSWLLAEQEKDIRHHFMLLPLASRFIPSIDLMISSLQQLTKKCATPEMLATQYQLSNAKKLVAYCSQNNLTPEGKEALVAFYKAAFCGWGTRLSEMHTQKSLEDKVLPCFQACKQEALQRIFDEARAEQVCLNPEQIAVLFNTLYDEVNDQTGQICCAMLQDEFERRLLRGEEPLDWAGTMLGAIRGSLQAGIDVQINTTQMLKRMIEDLPGAGELAPQKAVNAFRVLGSSFNNFKYAHQSEIREIYSEMLQQEFDARLQQGVAPVEWVGRMLRAARAENPMQIAPISPQIDTTRMLKRMIAVLPAYGDEAAEQAVTIFNTLGSSTNRFKYAHQAEIREAYTEMLQQEFDLRLQRGEDPLDWLNKMLRVVQPENSAQIAPINPQIDTTRMLKGMIVKLPQYRDEAAERAMNVFTVLGSCYNDFKYSRQDEIREAYTSMLQQEFDARVERGEDPVIWVGRMLAVVQPQNAAQIAPIDPEIDTTPMLTFALDALEKKGECSPERIADVFRQLGNAQSVRSDAVNNSLRMILDRGLNDASITNAGSIDIVAWMCNICAATQSAGTDISENLAQVFQRLADSQEWIEPERANYIFSTVRTEYAHGLDTGVRDAYTAMLTKRSEKYANNDTFIWLIAMCANAPYFSDENWLKARRSDAVTLLCKCEDATPYCMETVAAWIDNKLISSAEVEALAVWCDRQLRQGREMPALMLWERFDKIADQLIKFRNFVAGIMVGRMRNQLLGDDVTNLGYWLSATCKPMLARCGYGPENAFPHLQQEVQRRVHAIFEQTPFVSVMSEQTLYELETQIEYQSYRNVWYAERMSRLFNYQELLFVQEGEGGLKRLWELRNKRMLAGMRLKDSLAAAYELIGISAGTGKVMDSFNQCLSMRYDSRLIQIVPPMVYECLTLTGHCNVIRETVCECLSHVIDGVDLDLSDEDKQLNICMRKMRSMSYRHHVSASILRACFDPKNSVNAVNWKGVLEDVLNIGEFSIATRKPGSPQGLRCLQQLLSLMNVIQAMDETWASQLLAVIKANETLMNFMLALSKDKKTCKKYELNFSDDGILVVRNSHRVL